MLNPRLVVGLLIILLLAGCAPQAAPPAPVDLVAYATQMAATRRAQAASPVPNDTPHPPATYQPQRSTPTLTPIPPDTAAPTLSGADAGRMPFEPCSPLGGIQRSDLPRIVSAPYNPPPPGSDARHQGVDFAFYNFRGHKQTLGTPVQAMLGGKIAAALNGTFPYGNLVIIETPADILPPDLYDQLKPPAGYSIYQLYAHMQDNSLKVRLGDTVESCAEIGAVGKSGNTLSAHLHIEMRIGPPGHTFPGMNYFREEATKEEKAAYRLWRISWTFQHFDPLRVLGYGFDANWVTATPEKK